MPLVKILTRAITDIMGIIEPVIMELLLIKIKKLGLEVNDEGKIYDNNELGFPVFVSWMIGGYIVENLTLC